MKKSVLVFLMIFMACGYASAMQFSKHDAKAFKNAYLKEEIGLFNQHLKELKASKQYKSVRLLYPGANTELYYEVTNSDGKKGLLYSTISSNNEVKDTLLVPMQYYGFAIMPRTTGKEPYTAYNAQRTFTKQVYFHHEHEETVIFASITPDVSRWDIYSASHVLPVNRYKSAMTCNQILSKIHDNSISFVNGLIVLNAIVFCSGSEDHYLFLKSHTNNACLYTAAGQPICSENQNISTIVIHTESWTPKRKTRVQYISKDIKCGSGLLTQKEPWMPCIFADANFTPDNQLAVKCSQMSDYEIYDNNKDYSLIVKESKSPIAKYYKEMEYENGIKAFCEIPESQQTLEDIIYAATCCELAVTMDLAKIQNINSLLAHTADLQTGDLPNIEKTQEFILFGKFLFTNAKKQDSSLTYICDKGISNLTKVEQQLPAVLQEYEARDITRSAIYERQRQQAEFWGNLIGGFFSGLIDASVDAIDRRISGTSSTATYTPVSTYSNSHSTSSSSTTSTSTNESEKSYTPTTTGNSTRILELERKIRTYEGYLRDAQEFKRKCEVEHSNYLRQAIEDVNKYERIIREAKDELNRLKSGH